LRKKCGVGYLMSFDRLCYAKLYDKNPLEKILWKILAVVNLSKQEDITVNNMFSNYC